MDQNKVQTMQVYGHTIKYINETSDTEDIDQIKNSIDDGDREGTLFWEGMIVPIGRWWITDWKEIADKLYEAIEDLVDKGEYTSIKTIAAQKLYEDATKI